MMSHVLRRLPGPFPPCCGQGKTDTTLSRSSDFFVCMGTDIPERRMLTPTVVKHLDRVNDVITGFLTRQRITLRRALALQAAKKPLHDRSLSTLPLATHAARQTMGRQNPAVGMAGILRTTITMVYQASIWLATAPRHLQSIANQRRIQMLAHRPPHNLSRIQVH